MSKKEDIENIVRVFLNIPKRLFPEGFKYRPYVLAEALYNAGYRKQSEGEWQIKSEIYKLIDDVDEELYVECPFCKRRFPVPYEFDDEKIFKYAREHYPYCNCGAKMKGGAE